jgi:hypothetical protein
MGKWTRIAWVLKGVAGAAAAIALSPLAVGTVAVVAGLVAAGAGGLSISLPRDPWSAEKRRAKAGFDDEMDSNTPPEGNKGLPPAKK